MTNNCGIYKITNTVTGDFYIGSASVLRRRLNNHRSTLSRNRHENSHLQRAWNKYGEQAFDFTVLLVCNIENKLHFEQGLLNLLRPAYNMAKDATAPMQGLHHNDEVRHKISEANKGKRRSEVARAKYVEANKGENNPNFGKHLSEEVRAKIGAAQKGELNHNFGKHLSQETKRKLSERVMPEERNRKISEAHKGELNHNFGKHLSEQTKRKISEAAKRRYAEKKTTKEM